MNIPDKFQEIGIFIADYGLVPVLKQMTCAFVSEVVVDCISGEKPPHKRCESGPARLKKDVEMVCQQRPGEAFGAGLNKELRKANEEAPPVLIIAEYIAAVHTADDDVLQKVRKI